MEMAVSAQPIPDASLHDVNCVGPTHAWAVGDRGVIWHTDNGGRQWRLQKSTVTTPLHGVWFVDKTKGWAVGGTIQPFTWITEGVLLSTQDGGETWQREPTLLPAFRSIRLYDSGEGILCGFGSGDYPSGLFSKNLGEADWHPMDGGTRSHWLAGDLINPNNGVVIGALGQIGQIIDGRLHLPDGTPDKLTLTSGRSLRDVALVHPASGWLVGDGGLLLQSDNLGHGWQTVDSLPGALLRQADFRSIAVQGNHVWIGGNPGSIIFHSPDAGHTWQQQATGVPTPIEAIRFADHKAGWAVGALGTILGTRDGGRTWQTQLQGGKRAALLGIFATANELPLEALARLSKEDGYRVTIKILFPTNYGSDRENSRLQPRLAAALTRLDIVWSTVSWQFPLSPDEHYQSADGVIRHLNLMHDGRASERMVSELACAIRQWRPEALMVPTGTIGTYEKSSTSYPVDTIAREAAMAAIDEAADPTRLIDLTTQWELQPWQVQRVLGWIRPQHATPKETSAGSRVLSVTSDQIALRNGKTLGSLTASIRGYLAQDAYTAPLANTFLLLANRIGNPTGDLLAGLTLQPGGDARRRLRTPIGLPGGNLRALKRLAEKRRNMLQLVRTVSGRLNQEPMTLLAQIDDLIGDLDAESGSALLQELACQYHNTGHFDLEAGLLIHLARRYPLSPLASKGLLWLVQFYASGEAVHVLGRSAAHSLPLPHLVEDRKGRGSSIGLPQSHPTVEQIGPRHGGGTSVEEPPINNDPPIAGTTNLTTAESPAQAVELAKVVARTNRILYGEPVLRWPWAVAQRKRGLVKNAQGYWLSLTQLPPGNPWRECARAEKWLTHPVGEPPAKPIASCGRTESRPHLDGHLEESFWQSIRPLKLNGRKLSNRSLDSTDLPQSHVLVTRDNEYLYLALRCVKATAADYSPDDRQRPYDGDLSKRDRIRIFLDVDRDYTTWYELTIDSRGWTGDRVLESIHWNPQWFVAVDDDKIYWTAEAAIPWKQLASEAPKRRDTWAIAIGRVIPNVGTERWIGPPFRRPRPENFGLLIFE